MKCLDTEKLISYAYRLTDEAAAAQVRAHLAECPRCREIVEQHGRLDAVLSAWKVAEPSPGFDARVRQAVEAQQARREASWFWGWQWARGMALASVGILIIAGAVWLTHRHPGGVHAPQVATRPPQQLMGPQNPAQSAQVHSPATPAPAGKRVVQAGAEGKLVVVAVSEDKDTQALEDYDLAANFDLLSELPRGDQRVAN
jgi:anti-sigma factor RsiW